MIESEPILEERMVCVGHRDFIGDTDDPISFSELLKLPIILLRQGVSARAIMDDVTLLKKIEARAILQMNSLQAIAGSLEAGLGCTIGTRLFLHGQSDNGNIRVRPIINPVLSRTLYLSRLASRRPTFASETIRSVLVERVREAVLTGIWDAQLSNRS